MNQPLSGLVVRLQAIDAYRESFSRAYPGEPLGEGTLAKAIATFERSVVSGTAPFDRWIAGDEDAITDEAKTGFDLFNSKARCAKCHTGWNFTDDGFYDIGLRGEDRGRGGVLKSLEAVQFAFKTPTLRNCAKRFPFMHDGSQATLWDVIEVYNNGGEKIQRPSLSPDIVPLRLSEPERRALLRFLETLTSIDASVSIPILPR
jgi:cytochrome c peroxidase